MFTHVTLDKHILYFNQLQRIGNGQVNPHTPTRETFRSILCKPSVDHNWANVEALNTSMYIPKKKFLQDLTQKMLVILQDHTRKITKDFGSISGVIMHGLVSKIMVGN